MTSRDGSRPRWTAMGGACVGERRSASGRTAGGRRGALTPGGGDPIPLPLILARDGRATAITTDLVDDEIGGTVGGEEHQDPGDDGIVRQPLGRQTGEAEIDGRAYDEARPEAPQIACVGFRLSVGVVVAHGPPPSRGFAGRGCSVFDVAPDDRAEVVPTPGPFDGPCQPVSQSGADLRDLVEAYGRQLEAWVKTETERVVARFEAQAEVFRELIRRSGDPEDGGNAGDVMEIESDLRELTRAETAGALAEVARANPDDAEGNGRP
jgi:hypothetical protein